MANNNTVKKKKVKIKVPLNQNSGKKNKINNGERKYNKSKKSKTAIKRIKQKVT